MQDQNAAAEAEEAFAVETQIKAAMRDGRDALWRLMEALYAFDEKRGYLALGHENLSAWLADPEVSMTRTTYYRFVKTWGKLHVERKIDSERLRQLDASKASLVVDVIVAGKAPVDEVLSDVEELGARDLREKYLPPAKPKQVEPAKTDDDDDSGLQVEHEPLGEEAVAEIPDDELRAIVQDEERYSEEERQLAANEIMFRAAPADPDVNAEPESEADEEPVSGEVLPPEEEQTTSPTAQAVVDAEALPWDQLEQAFLTNVPNPRIPRSVLEAFLSWRETHLG